MKTMTKKGRREVFIWFGYLFYGKFCMTKLCRSSLVFISFAPYMSVAHFHEK
jgi:hypothetical protein